MSRHPRGTRARMGNLILHNNFTLRGDDGIVRKFASALHPEESCDAASRDEHDTKGRVKPLKELWLTGKWPFDQLEQLAMQLVRNTTLKSLRLNCAQVFRRSESESDMSPERDYELFSHSLAVNKGLTSFEISAHPHEGFGNRVLFECAKALAHNTTLKRLVLKDVYCCNGDQREESFTMLEAALTTNKTLEILEMSHCVDYRHHERDAVGALWRKTFTNVLKVNTTLKVLKLSHPWCWHANSQSTALLADAIKYNTTLERIVVDLRGNGREISSIHRGMLCSTFRNKSHLMRACVQKQRSATSCPQIAHSLTRVTPRPGAHQPENGTPFSLRELRFIWEHLLRWTPRGKKALRREVIALAHILGCRDYEHIHVTTLLALIGVSVMGFNVPLSSPFSHLLREPDGSRDA